MHNKIRAGQLLLAGNNLHSMLRVRIDMNNKREGQMWLGRLAEVIGLKTFQKRACQLLFTGSKLHSILREKNNMTDKRRGQS